MKYLAWAVSGAPEFQLKLSIRPCQALSLKYLFYGDRLQKVWLCAGFILHFVAVLAPCSARNATVSHTPPVPKDCSGLSMLVVWDGPEFGEKALFCLRDWLSPRQRGENRTSGKCRIWCVIKNSFCILEHLVQCWRPILFLGNNMIWLHLF